MAKKGLFLMLMLEDALARVQTDVDAETMRLTVLRKDPERVGMLDVPGLRRQRRAREVGGSRRRPPRRGGSRSCRKLDLWGYKDPPSGDDES